MYRKEFAEQAIVLRVGKFKDSDCWVKSITPNRGIVTGFAFGGLKSRKRFPGCIDPLNHVYFKFALNSKRTYTVLQEGNLLNRFSNLSKNTERLGMAVNCTKFLEAVQLDNSNAEQTFNILLSILKILNSSTEVSKNLPLYFRARLSVLYGYALSFEQCCFCNCKLVQHKSVGFKINTGQLACPYCINNFAKEWWIFSSSEFKHLKNVMLNSPENWPLKELSLSKLLKPIQAMDQFVQFHLGLIWKGNRFMQAA